MSTQLPHLYYKHGIELGVPDAVLSNARSQMSLILSRGSRPILTLNHLARLTGSSATYLRRIVQRTYYPYVDISRPKRSGATRMISAPEPVLLSVQRWILDNALGHVQHHSASFAYRKGVSIIDCAKQHVGARWLIKFDLRDFFGSVDEAFVFRTFRDGGYNSLVSFEMARLCTRMSRGYPQFPTAAMRDRYGSIPSYTAAKLGVLPQGAPTSGALANAAATQLDTKLSMIANDFGLVYTRYSDDLTFSAPYSWDRERSSNLARTVQTAVVREGFNLNSKKTRVVPPGARHIVLGLLVDDERVRLLPEFRLGLVGHVRGVERFGLIAHATTRNFRSILAFVRFIEGHISYAHAVDPEWARGIRHRWDRALHEKGYPVNSR